MLSDISKIICLIVCKSYSVSYKILHPVILDVGINLQRFSSEKLLAITSYYLSYIAMVGMYKPASPKLSDGMPTTPSLRLPLRRCLNTLRFWTLIFICINILLISPVSVTLRCLNLTDPVRLGDDHSSISFFFSWLLRELFLIFPASWGWLEQCGNKLVLILLR